MGSPFANNRRKLRAHAALEIARYPAANANQGVGNMSKSAPSGRAKRTVSAHDKTKTNPPAERAAAAAPPVADDRRYALIAESAYLRAAARGFSGGDPVADWLESEREVDALLSNGGR
jgi:hypothetical protein